VIPRADRSAQEAHEAPEKEILASIRSLSEESPGPISRSFFEKVKEIFVLRYPGSANSYESGDSGRIYPPVASCFGFPARPHFRLLSGRRGSAAAARGADAFPRFPARGPAKARADGADRPFLQRGDYAAGKRDEASPGPRPRVLRPGRRAEGVHLVARSGAAPRPRGKSTKALEGGTKAVLLSHARAVPLPLGPSTSSCGSTSG